ncbi:MAG: hypothetical protein O3B84_07335 [Chloroflexi bacterium]|nr:hypothetical protein [Chloroflexota bacterium]
MTSTVPFEAEFCEIRRMLPDFHEATLRMGEALLTLVSSKRASSPDDAREVAGVLVAAFQAFWDMPDAEALAAYGEIWATASTAAGGLRLPP